MHVRVYVRYTLPAGYSFGVGLVVGLAICLLLAVIVVVAVVVCFVRCVWLSYSTYCTHMEWE